MILGKYRKPEGSSEELYYCGNDHLGSCRVVYEDDGDVSDMFSYSIWGEKSHDIGSNDDFASFTGKEYDATGLIYFNARYYDPEVGRFLTEDPSQKGTSWYTYCNNNPLNFTDPTGRQSTEDDSGFFQWVWSSFQRVWSRIKEAFSRSESPDSSFEEEKERTILLKYRLMSTEKILEKLGPYGNPYELEGASVSRIGSSLKYIPERTIDPHFSLTPVEASQMASTGPGGRGGTIPIGGALGTLSAFQGTYQITTWRLRHTDIIVSHTVEWMRPTGIHTIGTGWKHYDLVPIPSKEMARAILLDNPDLVVRAIERSEPSGIEKAVMFLIDVLSKQSQ